MKQSILMPIMTFMTRFLHSFLINIRSFHRINISLLPLLGGLLFLISSCEDDGTLIGKNILPGGDFVTLFSIDTMSVYSYTRYSDSLYSNNPTYVFLGQMHDPYFGTTTAGFVTQLRLYSQWPGGVYTIDSVNLSLTLANVTGDVAAGNILKMSEIAEQIYPDSVYYSSRQVPLTGYSVEVPLPELRADTINDINLNLPVSFGEYILRDTSMLFHSDTESDFRSYFRGLYFELKPVGNPVFITMNISAPGDFETYKHQLNIYMHNEEGYIYVFILTVDARTKNAAFGVYNHDFSTADADKKIVHINDGFKDTLAYLQCLNGIFTNLEVPALETIKNDPSFDGIYINKARIICHVHYDGIDYKSSTFPSQLYMGYYNNLGLRYIVPDYSKVSASFFDGTIDTTAGNYTFNIARYVQMFLDDTTETYRPVLQLALPDGSLKSAILKANNSSSPMKFELTYTRF
jgi:hypothetical protein